jgi:hypothetical protein
VSTSKWSVACLSSTVLATGYFGRFFRPVPFDDTPGKLQLVKKLLDKLKTLLQSKLINDDSHDNVGLIDTFLDTSLQDFTEHGEVIPFRRTGLNPNRKMSRGLLDLNPSNFLLSIPHSLKAQRQLTLCLISSSGHLFRILPAPNKSN